MTLYKLEGDHDGVSFIEFDRNPNFIHDDILPDFVLRQKNHENCSDGIVDSLMEQ